MAGSVEIQGKRIALVLLLLRLSVFVVFLMWTLDKFLQPDHAKAVFAAFYGLAGLGAIAIYALGAAQLAIIVAFVVGYQKTWSYGLVLGMHAVSTVSSYQKYLDPFTSPNLLFFAAIPMLAACFALFYLRDLDRRWTLGA